MVNIRERLVQIKNEVFVIEDRVRTGDLSKDEAISAFAELFHEYYNHQLALERERIIPCLAKEGIDTLTTDTLGIRSASWFSETGKRFASGVVSFCFAFVICHKDIGMAVSHLNTVTLDDAISATDKFLDKLTLSPLTTLDHEFLASIVSRQSLLQTVGTGVDLTFGAFKGLLGSDRGVPPKGTYMFGCGINYLKDNPQLTNDVIAHIGDTIKEHPIMGDGRQMENGREIKFNVEGIGNTCGILYDGQSPPVFYNLG